MAISQHDQNRLEEIIFVSLPKIGENIVKEGVISSIETIKTIASVYCPLPGVIREGNQTLFKSQCLLNKDPKSEGWMQNRRSKRDIQCTANKRAVQSHPLIILIWMIRHLIKLNSHDIFIIILNAILTHSGF